MLDYTKYMNPRKCPTRLSIPRLARNTPTKAEINKYLSEVEEFDKAKVEYAKNLAAHQEAEAERLRQFKVDLFVAYGLYEVELYFSTLATLIKH